MPSKTLTDIFVANVKLKQGEKQQVFFDTKERIVLVVGTNTKTWRLLTYEAGKAKTQKLGRYPDMSLRDARQKARDFSEDPAKFTAQADETSYRTVAEKWVTRHVEARGLRSEKEVKRSLAKYIYPKWADRKFLEIRRGEINDLLDHVADNHGPWQADSVLKIIRSIWPAPGSEDTKLGVLMELEVGHGETEVYAGVQA